MTRCLSIIGALTLGLGLALAAGPPAFGAIAPPTIPGYILADLGSLGGGQTIPVAINAAGAVVGSSATAEGQLHAFLRPAGGSIQDLVVMSGTAAFATSLNNRNDVAGYLGTAAASERAFAIIGGLGTDLGLANATGSAIAVNDLRQVLLVSTDTRASIITSLWQNGQRVSLSGPGGSSFTGSSLNNLGQVAGTVTAADGAHHAVVYDAATHQPVDLGNIGATGTIAHINEIGQAVGTRTNSRGNRIAYAVDLNAANSLTDEVAQVGLSGSDAYWINNEGTAVGIGELRAPPNMNAVVWTSDGNLTNLNQALPANSAWTLLTAKAINDAGVIVGTALSPGGMLVAYMLTPMGPELPAGKTLAIADSLDAGIEVIRKGFDSAAEADAASPLETALVDLLQARSFLTPAPWQATVGAAGSGQASHLLASAASLLMSLPSVTSYLAKSDRDMAVTVITAAQRDLQ